MFRKNKSFKYQFILVDIPRPVILREKYGVFYCSHSNMFYPFTFTCFYPLSFTPVPSFTSKCIIFLFLLYCFQSF